MGMKYKALTIEGVQFHPESIMSLGNGAGHTLIRNMVRLVAQQRATKQAI